MTGTWKLSFAVLGLAALLADLALAQPAGAVAAPAVPAAVTATAVTSTGAPAGVPTVAGRRYLHDEADVFNDEHRRKLTSRIEKLAHGTNCELYVWTRVVATLQGFEADCETLFQTTVKEAGHYRVVLVVLGYEGTPRTGPGRGKVYTAIGAGLLHVLTRQKLEGFLARGGPKVTNETVLQGIDDLAASLEANFKRTESVASLAPLTPVAGPVAPPTRLRMDLAAGVCGVIVLMLIFRRLTRCPQCGARLRRQVKILPAGAEGGSHAVRRTAKCFACGYVRKGTLF